LQQVIRSAPLDRPLRLSVGVSASIHKLIAFHLIEPALQLERDVQLSCRTGRVEDLLRDLNRQQLDVLLTDRVPASGSDRRWHLHELRHSSISLFAAPDLARQLAPGFPASLNGQPFLANALDAPYLHQLTRWFSEQGVRLRLKAEIDDSALIKVFGHQGLGVFAAPTLITEEVCRQYEVVCIGCVEEVTETLFAITRSRRSTHPAVEAICSQSMAAI
jgi:LysR family transcriptional activator of nhaA